ncbi:MAG: hypothetical protein EZS28_040568, partial [Streblomastix strix]
MMTRWGNFASKRPTGRDSYQTLNCANLVPQNPLQVVAQPKPTLVNAFRQNLRQTHQTRTKQSQHQRKYRRTRQQQHGCSWQGYLDKKLHKSIFTRRNHRKSKQQRLVNAQEQPRTWQTRRKPPKHNNPLAQRMLAFDLVLADLETKLLQQYRLQQKTLTQIVKRDLLATLKFNLCTFINIYDTIYKVNMTRALIDTTEQGNLLKTQPSPVIRPGYNNKLLRSLRALPQTDGAHPASVDTLLTRIVGFTGELDQELKKLTAKQVIDMNGSKPEIMPPDWAQDLVRKPTSESPTDCVFTTTELITTVEPESIPTTESILQPVPSTVDVGIITITIPFPILRATNAIPNSTSSIPSYPTTKSVFSNGDPTVNTNERT